MSLQDPAAPRPAVTGAELAWSDALLLGYTPMDTVHEDFVRCARALSDAPDAGLPEALRRMAEHLRTHVAQEDAWMSETDFPPRQCGEGAGRECPCAETRYFSAATGGECVFCDPVATGVRSIQRTRRLVDHVAAPAGTIGWTTRHDRFPSVGRGRQK